MVVPQPHTPVTVGETPKPKRCGAKKRNGDTCQSWAVGGRSRCRMHGGATPKGPDSPHWRHGNGAKGNGQRGPAGKAQPNLEALYQAAKGDPELFQFRHDAALLEAARRQITLRLSPDKVIPAATLKKLIDLGEQLRKVKEAEHRRLVALQMTVPVERHRRAMALAATVVADVMRERAEQLRAAILVATAEQPEAVKTQLLALADTRLWSEDMAHRFRMAALREPAVAVEALVDGQET